MKIRPNTKTHMYSRNDMIAFSMPKRHAARTPDDLGIIRNVRIVDGCVVFTPNVTNTRFDRKMRKLNDKYGLLLG